MSKLTKKQQKMQQMLEGFNQPATAVDTIKKLKEIIAYQSRMEFPSGNFLDFCVFW